MIHSTLTFETNNSSTANITQEYNSAITLPTPTPRLVIHLAVGTEIMAFANQFTQTRMPTENVTLYGKWGQKLHNYIS